MKNLLALAFVVMFAGVARAQHTGETEVLKRPLNEAKAENAVNKVLLASGIFGNLICGLNLH